MGTVNCLVFKTTSVFSRRKILSIYSSSASTSVFLLLNSWRHPLTSILQEKILWKWMGTVSNTWSLNHHLQCSAEEKSWTFTLPRLQWVSFFCWTVDGTYWLLYYRKKYYGSEWVPSTVRSLKHHLQCSAEEKSCEHLLFLGLNECLSSAEQLTAPIDFYTTGKNTMEVNGCHQPLGL